MPFDAKCSPHPAREKGRRARDEQRVQLLFHHPRSSDSPRAYASHTYIVSQLPVIVVAAAVAAAHPPPPPPPTCTDIALNPHH